VYLYSALFVVPHTQGAQACSGRSSGSSSSSSSSSCCCCYGTEKYCHITVQSGAEKKLTTMQSVNMFTSDGFD